MHKTRTTRKYLAITGGLLVAVMLLTSVPPPGPAVAAANRPVSGLSYQSYLPLLSNLASLPTIPLNLSLTPNPASGQPVGTTITWTAAASDSVPIEYRFSVALQGRSWTIVRDYAPSPSFTWSPIDEGAYQVQVMVKEVPPSLNPAVNLTSAPYALTSRVPTGSTQPVVSPTSHPLVALYSIPPCGSGTVQVQFGAALPTQPYQTTPALTCSPSQSTNVYLVGMRPTTTYAIQATVTSGATNSLLPPSTFVTGAIPPTVAPFPTIFAPVPAGSGTSTLDGIVFHNAVTSGTSTTQTQMYATDLSGAVVWYYNNTSFPTQPLTDRPLVGGNVIALLGNSLGANQVLRIIDPLGNPVRETSTGRLNEELAAFVPSPGHTVDQISQLHHESNLLPNGHTVIVGYIERLFPPGTQGSTTGLPVDILGDEIIDLDQNLQVDWTWNAFDYLDVNRPAVLGETCQATGGGCPYSLIYGSQTGGIANDWTHSNAISYAASDHTLLVSVRHQDWILKINYQDGTGDGHILWHLGNQGDFAFTNPPAGDAFPWFSHQHGIQITGGDALLTFDNGNTRCTIVPNCHSRGQFYQLDETTKRATILVDADMGNYSVALGWAQLLQNGDYSFTSGLQSGTNPTIGQDEEFDSSGKILTYVLQDQPEWLYRAYRMPTMYSGCCGD